MHPSVLDVTLPFASSYARLSTTLGITAGWLAILLGLSYYARARIGVQRWRRLHRWTALAWLIALAHALGEGTDAGRAWFLVATAIVAIPALVLLAQRLSGGSGRPRSAPAGG